MNNCCDWEAKGIVPFPCHLNFKTQLLLLTCAPALRATSIVQYSKFQNSKGILVAASYGQMWSACMEYTKCIPSL